MTETAAATDLQLLAALRAGDDAAFAALAGRLYGTMLHVALGHVGSRAVAEEVVQDTWVAVLGQLDRFEGRASLRTWVLRILANVAKSRGARERRAVPFSSLAGTAPEGAAPDRLLGAERHWATLPRSWADVPEERLASSEALARIRAAIGLLPPGQQAVITLRDVHGWTSREVCDSLGLSPGNQRVLLHRARARVRRALADWLEEPAGAGAERHPCVESDRRRGAATGTSEGAGPCNSA
jgi:RNA polymerase sigma-70 factor (ECF subfamily)